MRVLVVGVGSMGRRRLRNLSHIGGAELAAFEPTAERREAAGSEFAIPVFAEIEQGMEWGPDALVVSTPPDRHAEYALLAANAGLAFFTEASVVSDGMEEVLAAVAATGTLAAPSCTMRFHPAVRVMRRRIAAGAIGRPLALVHHVGQYLPDWHPWEDYRTFYAARRDTGAAREIVPFELNWLTYLFGAVIELNCFRAKLSQLEVDIDDIYSTLLRFESQVQGSMVIEALSRPGIRRARIVGEEGTLEWDWEQRRVLEWAGEAWSEHPDPPAIAGPGGAWVAENMYIEEMRGFLKAVQEGAQHWPLTLEDDLALLNTVVELERASDEQRRGLVAAEPG
ncbi:MAG TPA: Gfo/Idh/MocA family oxidoreductase [Solirubrobacteraceae bacterium]|jgi:predicted dehydrogenase|nr:Gfo/Idh/MocA family oxidoreductase [Solirubrobacteraceae bacterium]